MGAAAARCRRRSLGERARRPAPAGPPEVDRGPLRRAEGDAPLRGRRHVGGHRGARHGVPRPAVHPARLRLPRLVAQAATWCRPSSTTGGWSSCCSRSGRRPVAVQGAAPQLPPRGDRRRLPRRPVRDDAPRPGEGGAVVGEPRVGALPRGRRASATCTGSGARCRTTSGSGVEQAIAARGPHRRGPLPRRAPPRIDRRPDGHGRARLRLPRPRARPRRSSRRSPTGSEANRSGAHGTHRYTAEQFGLTDAQLRDDYASTPTTSTSSSRADASPRGGSPR